METSVVEKRITKEHITQEVARGTEYLFSAAYKYKIPTSNNIKMCNIHPTLLPEGRGPWPLPYCILNNLAKSSVTLHKLTRHFDKGDTLI